MSIRNEFEKIDPTEKQKKDIFRRIEESSKVKTDFRHQVIRYTSVAAALIIPSAEVHQALSVLPMLLQAKRITIKTMFRTEKISRMSKTV